MKRPPSRLDALNARREAERKMYRRRRFAALGVLGLAVVTFLTAINAASWANERPTTTARTTAQSVAAPVSDPLLPTPQAAPKPVQHSAPKAAKPAAKTAVKAAAKAQVYVITGHTVPLGLHPSTATLKAASKVKHTDKFPRGANMNANDRRSEWLASDRTVKPGTVRAVAVGLVLKQGWPLKQWGCLDRLWWHESGWNYHAGNKYGAYGIPQSLPGHKMSSVAGDWKTNPTTQITWGIEYIAERYGTPCKALSSWGKRAVGSQGWY